MKRQTETGFTIIELLIAIVVIGVLAGIVTVTYSGIQERAKKLQYDSMVRDTKKQIKFQHALNDYYPDGDELNLDNETKKHFRNNSLMYTANKDKYWKMKGIFYSGHHTAFMLRQCFNGVPNLASQDSPVFSIYYDYKLDQIVKEIYGCDKNPSEQDEVEKYYSAFNILVRYVD